MSWILLSSLLAALSAAPAEAADAGFLIHHLPPDSAQTLPLHWSPDKNIAWRAELPGDGQSSPVIHGDRVFVTSVSGDQKEKLHVLAVSLQDGRELWQRTFDTSLKAANSLYVSRAAPTAAVDRQQVYAFFESGDVVALSHDGEVRWQRSLVKDFGAFQAEFGLAASVAQDASRIFLLADHDGPSYLLALDKQHGTTAWKTDRASRISWSSPRLLSVAGAEQVVVSSSGSIEGYEPSDGRRLWQVQGVGGNTVASPQLADNGLLLIGAAPGREGKDEGLARQSNFALHLNRDGQQWAADKAWQLSGTVASFASPVAHREFGYWINRAGAITCVRLSDGEVQYTERLEQACWASPLAVDQRLYCFGKDGVTTVIATGPKFEKLAVNRLWSEDQPPVAPEVVERETKPERRAAAANFAGPIQYGATAVPGSLLIRTGRTLYCLREAASPAAGDR